MSNMSMINKNAIFWFSVDRFSEFRDLNILEFSENEHRIKLFLDKGLKIREN